jgi:hypothetical protein
MYPDLVSISGSPNCTVFISSSAHFGRDSSFPVLPSFVPLLETCALDLGITNLTIMYHYSFLKNFADRIIKSTENKFDKK